MKRHAKRPCMPKIRAGTKSPLATLLLALASASLGATALLPLPAQSDPALAARGKALSKLHCARCHVVTPDDRMSGISSTPSFMIMVTALDDWQDRFETFHARRPHPAHVRFETDGERPPDQPATIEEVVLQIEDIEAIVAYAQSLKTP